MKIDITKIAAMCGRTKNIKITLKDNAIYWNLIFNAAHNANPAAIKAIPSFPIAELQKLKDGRNIMMVENIRTGFSFNEIIFFKLPSKAINPITPKIRPSRPYIYHKKVVFPEQELFLSYGES